MTGGHLIQKRTEWSTDRISAFMCAVTALREVTEHSDLCIYVTGSFGRLEASEHSDLDLFFIKGDAQSNSSMSYIDKTLMNASLIYKCREMDFPEFSGDGEYLEVHYLHDMRENLGGRRDDFDNLFTARLLLLLESLPIYNEGLYEEVLREITKSYFRDYENHEENFQPTFLVNDVLRFWKTLCLNYEHSRNREHRNDREIQKSHLKNLKLKFSRMLTCFSLVIPLAVPRDSIEPEQCVELMRHRPLKRLERVAVETNNMELWDRLAEDYGWFLESTGQPRDEVLTWIASRTNRENASYRANRFGETMYKLLVAVSKPETMRYLVI